MAKIAKIWAREILDSRAIPTVEVAGQTDSGHVAVASVPGGTSIGSHEDLEIRDGDETRYKGMGVLRAVENVNKILGPLVSGMDPMNQEEIDQKMLEADGTQNQSKYGANAILPISVVTNKLASQVAGYPQYVWINLLMQKLGLKSPLKIPTPIFNMINGGLHGAGNLDFQEFWVIPATAKTYSQGLVSCVEIYLTIGENLARRGAIHSVGNEGGYAPNLFTNADALEVLVESIKQANYAIGRDVFLGLDVAANSFYKNGEYTIKDKSAPLDETGMLEYYKILNEQYRLALLEDPFQEDAWGSWNKLYAMLADQLIVVGDDLLATNPKRVERAIKEKSCNGILVKPNQAGTVTETLKVIKQAKEANWKILVSHRSGETNDAFIADFAVGVSADYTKFGAPARGERVAKYNRLSSIEQELANMPK
ncbi:phosphopyruvate hydratase [Candidatus Woesebacteria bacterium RIFOXYB1_FULL_40_26]|uniref:Enolase n=3 Tax=Candidatus Woeseibacteriota TaxID=1752722 RepID=A0A0G0SEN5_9BACT|nr:MAG: Enolase [Candidatus Woesebacteria bacterium GW2011_GWA1_40_45]OGM81174.1 MAG: phosphopyruvate hydratase [Candidatus Woesebacteria bacterium RIFOXYB1_FULL_40_26]OGM87640.1 MAG: phosphopyruvate hydratase [Candidatus Woesebacteria bacterium RIFOXYD1_FULL_40_21]